MENSIQILYFADPMCSWCYGFSPVVQRLQKTFSHLDWTLIPGGLRPYVTEQISKELKEELSHHWHQVQVASGQPFDFGFNFPESFCYDTEPACRAMMVVQNLAEAKRFDFLAALHKAFYEHNQDLTNPNVLVQLAEKVGIEEPQFLASFNDPDLQMQTKDAFAFTQEMGVRGFPNMIGYKDGKFQRLAAGYAPYEQMELIFQKWMSS
ncbi:MAG: hypothetical protein A2527_03120 [Candidatus Lambdaproteobacteria bacterium RIFOXYD2_FULL_50_16]|uniref:DSBA-like thioredoxin domain-containing protein n=1 Tax=Candidatus Lambdaproteobacteria bacterium RIFOXYD2_FULL_50_16 TaxID=1817772 RepID=A0A1F6GG33_9PROT|nr:MAG: hypothetical protein A2527_03120 [Candidatus Lambdaproteobacteria bacterium RIFOXYD2_FULL_50_16]